MNRNPSLTNQQKHKLNNCSQVLMLQLSNLARLAAKNGEPEIREQAFAINSNVEQLIALVQSVEKAEPQFRQHRETAA